jgi:hypothetical protein
MNRIGTFDLLVHNDPLLGTMAWIFLAQWGAPNLVKAKDTMTVTAQCVSFEELAGQVAALKADLDTVLQKARQHF